METTTDYNRRARKTRNTINIMLQKKLQKIIKYKSRIRKVPDRKIVPLLFIITGHLMFIITGASYSDAS